MSEVNLTVKDRAGRDVPAKTLVDRYGRDVINPNTGEPFVVPRDYDPQRGIDLGRRIGSQIEEAIDDFSLSQLQAKIYSDLVQAFKQGGPEDLQRSYNGKVGGGGPEFVDVFRDAASYHFGMVAAAAGLYSGTIYAGGGFYNLYNYIKDVINKGSSKIELGFMFNNPRNAKSIEKGISDLEKGIHESGGRNAQHLDQSLIDSDSTVAFGSREVSAADGAKAALKAGAAAMKVAAVAENSQSQTPQDQSSDPGSNLPGARSGNSGGGSSGGSGGQSGSGHESGDGGNPSQGGSSPNSGNGGDQGGGGDDRGGRGSTSNGGSGYGGHGSDDGDMPGQRDNSSGGGYGGHGSDDGDMPGQRDNPSGGGYDWGGREGERPGPGGSLSPPDSFGYGTYGGDPYTQDPDPPDPLVAPIVLDLDGDGIEIVPLNKSKTYFDYNGDGAVGHTAWIGSGDGFLVFDADDSNTVNRASEFVFTQWSYVASRDMWALRAVFDTNKDETLSAADKDFDKFKVWVDADGDAVTDPGELKSLRSLGLASIPLTHNGAGKQYSDGSRIYGTATAKTTKGDTITVADVGLTIGTRNASIKVTDDKIDILRGDGTSKSVFTGKGDRNKALKLGKSGYDVAFIKQSDGTRLTAHYELSGVIKSLLHQTAGGRTTKSEVWSQDQVSVMEFDKNQVLTRWEMAGNASDNIYKGGDEVSVLDGERGDDALHGGAGDDTLKGGKGHDRLNGDEDADRLEGQDGDDTLKGGAGADTLYGGEGYDDLHGGEGQDLLSGDEGRDYLDGEAGDDTLRGGNGIDELHGGAGNDRLEGEAEDDMLFGDEGDDSLDGGAGRDELQGGLGNDTLNGGADRDWLVGGDGSDLLSGGDGEDRLIGGAEADRLIGGEGRDTLEGGDDRDILEGGTGDDRLRGDADDDVLHGEDGADDLNGGAGNDLLYGGAGDDALIGETGNDTLAGGTGDDALVGDGGDDRLSGETGSDVLKGGDGLDLLSGEAGADYLYGGSGHDTLLGGSEDDLLYGDEGADSLDGGSGEDKLWGGSGDDTLLGGLGHDVLTGDAGADSLDGGLGDDKLSGGAGHDSLVGGGGADQLFGGEGNDILYGGPDADYIDGGSGTDTIVLTGNRTDYLIRFNTALGRYSIVDLRSGSPDGTDLADIEIFRFADGELTIAELNYITAADVEMAHDVESSDGSKSRIGWRPSADDPSVIEAYVQRRNIAGDLLSETVFRPNGTRLAYAWDLTGMLAWSSYVQTYDSQANLVSQVDTNRNGTFTKWEFDPEAIDAHDWLNRETTYLNQAYYEAGVASRVFETIDDGKLGVVDFIERLWDLTGQTWGTKVRELNTAKQVLIETIVNDDGSSLIRGFDYGPDGHNYRDGMNSAQQLGWEWISFEEHRDTANNKTEETYHYYSYGQQAERTVERGWDYSGQAWTRYVLNKDHLLRETVQQTWFDNGTHAIKEWNWSGQTWAWRETLYSGATPLTQWDQYEGQRHTYREWNGGIAFDERETQYNVNGIHYYQHITKGGQKVVHEWDRTDAYDWVEKITTTDNGITTRVEKIYGDRKIVEIFDNDGDEWTYRVQEWRGTNFADQLNDKFYKGADLVRQRKWDLADEAWDYDDKRYHDNSVVYHKVIKDNNTYTIDRVDYESKTWDMISIRGKIINEEEKAYWTETLYDDAYWIVEEKDLGRDDWDTKIWKSREYGGQRLNFVEGITFDDPLTEGGRTYTTFIAFFDRPDKMNWASIGIYAMDMDQGGDWAGWILSDDRVDGRGVIAAEIVRRLKSWNGLDVAF